MRYLLSIGSSESLTSLLNRFKSELCRNWEEKRTCRYGLKCQFAHGDDELRKIPRHPKVVGYALRVWLRTDDESPYSTRQRSAEPSGSLEHVLMASAAASSTLIRLRLRPPRPPSHLLRLLLAARALQSPSTEPTTTTRT